MASSENILDLIDNIFINNQIDPVNLKNFLKLISNQNHSETKVSTPNQGSNLAEQMAKCEERLENKLLLEIPKTEVAVRHKLESLDESIQNLKNTNIFLQAQIDENTRVLNELMKHEITITRAKDTFEDTANRFQKYSINSEVCELKRKVYEIENHLRELTVNSNALKDEVKNIEEQIINTSRIPELEEKFQKLLDWRASLREDIEMLTERYEHVKTIKISKCEVDRLIENKINYKHLSKYVPKVNFDLAKEDFFNKFQELKQLFCEVQIHLTSKLVDLHKDVQKIFLKLASKQRIEKRSI